MHFRFASTQASLFVGVNDEGLHLLEVRRRRLLHSFIHREYLVEYEPAQDPYRVLVVQRHNRPHTQSVSNKQQKEAMAAAGVALQLENAHKTTLYSRQAAFIFYLARSFTGD